MMQKKDGRRGPGSGGKKAGSKNARCALDSITSRNNAKEQYIVMESERGLRGDIYAEMERSASYVTLWKRTVEVKNWQLTESIK
jgi:hypothetical protein